MKARHLKPGHRIRARGRTWVITLIRVKGADELELFLDADDAEGTFRWYDTAELYAKPESEVETA